MFHLLLLAMGAATTASAGGGGCSAALDSACGTLKGPASTAACDRCVLFHVTPLTAAGSR